MDLLETTPRFWACELRSGTTLEQEVPPGGCLFLTGASLAPGEAGHTALWASSGAFKAVLCNIRDGAALSELHLAQPFASTVTFSQTPRAGSTAPSIHLSGYTRGEVGALRR